MGNIERGGWKITLQTLEKVADFPVVDPRELRGYLSTRFGSRWSWPRAAMSSASHTDSLCVAA